jgi:biotin-(acetyl-CoA carboxylase) ligase
VCYEQTGLIHFIDLWRKHDYLAGKNVTVSLPDQIILGEAQGIADTGELLVFDQNAVMLQLAYGETSVRVC